MVTRHFRSSTLLGTIFLMACGASGTQRATIDSAPPPRPAEPAPAQVDSAATTGEAPSRTATEVTGNPTPSAQEYPAAVRIGARVADVRTDPGSSKCRSVTRYR